MRAFRMQIAIIVNPISGRDGRRDAEGRRRLDLAHRLMAESRVSGDVALTKAKGHGVALGRDFMSRGFDVVMAWGGDGTANEVATSLIGTRTALGVIPSGSGDGLAGSLGLPADPAAAVAAAARGVASRIDVGYLDGRHFLNAAGVGFDAAIARAFNRGRRRGALRYIATGLGLARTYRAGRYRVRLGDDRREGAFLMIAFANGREYGNRLVLSSAADARDGWLDAVVVDDGPSWKRIWRSRRLALAPDRPAEGIGRVRLRTAEISGDRLECHVDGEAFDAGGTAAVTLSPRALRIAGLAESPALPAPERNEHPFRASAAG